MPDREGSTEAKPFRLLALVPLPYHDTYGFWNRDLGLVVRSLKAKGCDASLIAFKTPESATKLPHPLIVATRSELSDPGWWQAQRPDAIILNTWSATRFEDIRRAALSVGKPLIEKLDTDGVKSPRVWLWRYTARNLVNYKHTDSFVVKLRCWIEACARSAVVWLFPSILDEKMVRSMSRVPMYAAESPVAVARVKRFLRMYRADPMPRVVTIPHPVNIEELRLQENDTKENIVIAVGRWKEAVKGWPLLFEVARRFLEIHPDWKLVVAGDPPSVSSKDQALLDAMKDRLIIAGSMDHAQLSGWYRRSKIYLLPSHWETFNIAAAEALCCGCSVVGPAQIASVGLFISHDSGTIAYLRQPRDMTDALVAEVDEWNRGRRDPKEISRWAVTQWSVDCVIETYRKFMDELATRPTA